MFNFYIIIRYFLYLSGTFCFFHQIIKITFYFFHLKIPIFLVSKLVKSFKKLLTFICMFDIMFLSFITTDFELGVLISIFANYCSRNANPLHPLSAEI